MLLWHLPGGCLAPTCSIDGSSAEHERKSLGHHGIIAFHLCEQRHFPLTLCGSWRFWMGFEYRES